MTTSAKLRKMARAASPAPWTFSTTPQPNGCPIIGSKGIMVAMLAHSIHEPRDREIGLANAKIIVTLRNETERRADLEDAVRNFLAVVDEREKGLTGYYIDAKRFDALRVALAALNDTEDG